MKTTKSLKATGSDLASGSNQIEVLEGNAEFPRFQEKLADMLANILRNPGTALSKPPDSVEMDAEWGGKDGYVRLALFTLRHYDLSSIDLLQLLHECVIQVCGIATLPASTAVPL